MPEHRQSQVGVDFDRTLAVYTRYIDCDVLGDPIPLMVDTVKRHLDRGDQVVIFTARVHPDHTTDEVMRAEAAIKAWCRLHIGVELPVTCMKSPKMHLIYDDRAVGIFPNTGERVDGQDGSLSLPQRS